MGDYIPVFFFSAKAEELPDPFESWLDADDLIAERMEAGTGFRQATSRNWWHQRVTREIAAAWGLSGLDFLGNDLAVVKGEGLAAAIDSMTTVLERLGAGECPSLGHGEVFTDSGWLEAFREARPGDDVSADADDGREANVAFFAWLKSLDAALRAARDAGECFVLVQPQP